MTVMIKQGLLRVNILAMTMKKMPWKGNKEKSPKGGFFDKIKTQYRAQCHIPARFE